MPEYYDTHSGEDVAVYARGPMAYLLSGTYDQSYVGNVIKYAACYGNMHVKHCPDHREYHTAAPKHTISLKVLKSM